ncbi:MAG TPA: TonB-dependent receptor [Sphingomicrobium sp.]|nr:TonB-dependent receptor [Sphingomicrobium sp.]
MTSTLSVRQSLMLGSATLCLLTGLASPALAQEARPSADQAVVQAKDKSAEAKTSRAGSRDASAIVVTGFRRSVQNSISVKRDSPIIEDVVSADDIAGLPDLSIAEAIARLPGVTAQRSGGQASAINIRGLNQDLVSATLNGREQVATSGLRTIEFDQYPSELLTQAAVYKSPMASQIEGGIAGKVELKTARPLDNTQDLVGSINIRGSWNDRAKQDPDAHPFGYRVSGSIQAKLLQDKLGIALGYARLVQPNVATRFDGYDYVLTGTNGGGNALDLNKNGVRDAIGYGMEVNQFGGTETRDGALGVVQFEPSPSTRLLVDGYWSRFNSDVRRRGVRFAGEQNGNTQLGTLTNPVLAGDAIVGGHFQSGNGVDFESVNQDESDRDRLYTIGANFQQDFGKRLTLSLDASYSTANSYFYNAGVNVNTYVRTGNTYTRAANVPGALQLDYQLNGLNLPTMKFNWDFTNPDLNRLQGYYIVPQEDNDSLSAYAADLTYKVDGSFLKSFQFGARYSSRTAWRKVTAFDSFGLADNVALPAGSYEVAGFSGDYASHGFPDFLAVNINKVLDQFVGPNRPTDQFFGFTIDQSFRINEKVWAAYAQMNFDSYLQSLHFHGNLGLRAVHTDQNSTSSLTDPTSATGARYESTLGDKYWTLLPSANLVFDLDEHNRVRFSASRQMSRARFYDLRNAISFGLTDIGGGLYQPQGGGGNPRLRPYLAKQVDLDYEHYFGRSGIFTAGVFYKQLESFITSGTIYDFDYRAAGLTFPPLPTNAPPGATVQNTGPLSAPINGQGGKVYGFETQFTKTFTSLPAPFDGLGVILNYAYTKSSLHVTSPASGQMFTLPLIGLSTHVFNPTLFYDKNGFSARVGVRYRSGFVASHFGFGEQVTANGSETIVDAQLSYAFPKASRLNGLTLYLQGNNLTDSPTRAYFGQEAQTNLLQQFGRFFYAGATIKF